MPEWGLSVKLCSFLQRVIEITRPSFFFFYIRRAFGRESFATGSGGSRVMEIRKITTANDVAGSDGREVNH